MRQGPFIVVAGNIGVGKSMVAQRLADELGLEVHLQSGDENPYLPDFYDDMPRWALHSQLQFLADGIATNRRIQFRAAGAIEESSVFEHFTVFCDELHDRGVLSDREHKTLSDMYYSVEDLLTAPDLFVHLHAPALVLHRRLSGRPGGSQPTLEYLQALEKRYETMMDTWFRSPVLSIDMTKHDVTGQQGLDAVAELVNEALSDLI